MGKITKISTVTETVEACFDGKNAIYGFDELDQLEHSYAVTVHYKKFALYCDNKGKKAFDYCGK